MTEVYTTPQNIFKKIRAIYISTISLSSFIFLAWDPSDKQDIKGDVFKILLIFSVTALSIDSIKALAVRQS